MVGVEFVALGNFSAPPAGVDPADIDLGVYSIGKTVAYPGARLTRRVRVMRSRADQQAHTARSGLPGSVWKAVWRQVSSPCEDGSEETLRRYHAEICAGALQLS